MKITVISALVLVASASMASAVVTVDGTRDASYGSPLAVQQNPTGFGNSNLGVVDNANGSELDAIYSEISGGQLHLFLSGNLETNFNKLDIFLDSATGGMNRLTPLTGGDQGNFSRMADNGTGNGLTFDSGFTANRWISVTAGGSPTSIFVDYANLDTGTGNFAGSATPANGAALSGGNGGPSFTVTFNNSNTAGVDGATAPNDAASVATGIELSIALADLGYVSGPLNVSAFINGSGQDFISNQVLGSLPVGSSNPGDPRNVNFASFAGNQFVNVVPEPTTLGVIAGMGIVALRRRK